MNYGQRVHLFNSLDQVEQDFFQPVRLHFLLSPNEIHQTSGLKLLPNHDKDILISLSLDRALLYCFDTALFDLLIFLASF